MTPAAFMTAGNVHIVPVLRNRLAFAITVRRALAALQAIRPWRSDDLIAIVLPPSVIDSLRTAIRRLPHVSLVFLQVDDERGKEVLAVTPCDGMIEALRTADENGWPVELVDLEISPGNLQRAGCLRDPEWPDDTFALTLGVERYLDMIEGYFAQPPARLEPLDTMRERHIVQRVRSLQPFHGRILLVCDAGLARSVKDGIEKPHGPIASSTDQAPKLSCANLEQVNLDVLLSYLDDYPRIVALYDKARESWHAPSPETFDKFGALMDAVLESADIAKDLNFSPRQHQTFSTFLKNLLRHDRRFVPTPDVLFGVAQSCFNRAFAERLHCFLSEYAEQIAVERIRPTSTAQRSMFRYKVDVSSSAAGYVGRECHPTPPRYADTRLKQRSQIGRSAHNVAYHWLPEERFLFRMHQWIRKAIASVDQQRRSTREYRGSIEMGVDIRTTIRSAASRRLRLYVKANTPFRHGIYARNEPIVWILDENYHGQAYFSAGGIERQTASKWELKGPDHVTAFPIGTLDVYRPFENSSFNKILNTLAYNEDHTGQILYAQRCGWINFGWDFEDEEDARAALGDAFDYRFPNHDNYHDPRDKGRLLGCVDPDFRDLQSEGGPWREIALMTALKYADAAIVVAAPAGFVVPPRAADYSARLGKAIHVVTTNFLSRSDHEKFRSHYIYYTREGRDLAAEKNFEILMRGYWE